VEHDQDLTELLQGLKDQKVDFLIVGGYAVMKYTEPRFTKDLDIWIRATADNAERVYRALAKFGAPLEADGLTIKDFASHDITYQIGRPPLRADIITRIDGVTFQDAWPHRAVGTIAGAEVNFIGLDDLIRNKEATGRSSDAEHLKLLRKQKKSINLHSE
jgi:predicted nucleotidyltransferase